MAKRLFYVCAGLFLLSLSYHLGARSAIAQAREVEAASVEAGAASAIVIGRHLWTLELTGDHQPHQIPVPIPGNSPVIACSVSGVLLEDGDFWLTPSNSSANEWGYVDNFFAGPTGSVPTTLGAIKARYR